MLNTPNSYQVHFFMQNTPNSYQVHNDLCDFIDSPDHDDQQTLAYISSISEDALAKIINKQHNSGLTLLHYAVKKEKIAVIEYLLDKGARYDIENSSSETAYDYTKYFARADDIKNLMSGNSPIHQCAIKGEIEGIEQILNESASNLDFSIIDAKNRDGNTPLHLSVINQKTDTLRFLLNTGARIDQKNNEGNTPLQLACKKGDLQIVKHLMYIGADLKVIDRGGNNLLHLLSRSGISGIEIFNKLVKNGVNPNLRNKLGDTPLHHLLRGDEPNQPAITSLINIGANINAIDRHGETPLLISLKKPENGFFLSLLQIGANPNFPSSNLTNETPLERFVINLTAYFRRNNSNAQNFHNAVNTTISDFMRFGLKLTPEIKQKISSNGRIPQEIKTFINNQNQIQIDYDNCLKVNPKILEETTKSIFRGNLVLDPAVPLTTSKVTSLDSYDNDMIGDVFVESIKSISKEKWDLIKKNPEKLKKLQDSGFATLIELSQIPDKDGEKFVDNDIAIKTAIKGPGDFIAFYKEFVKIMSTNKSIINNLLKPKDSKDSEMIIDFNPTENSSKFDATQILSIEPLLLALLSPEFKKELDVQDKISNSKLKPEEARQDSKIKLIMSLAQIINSKLKKDLSPSRPDEFLSFVNAIGVLASDPRLGTQPSGKLTELALDKLLPSGSNRPSALGGSASQALGGSASRALGGSASGSNRPSPSALGGSASGSIRPSPSALGGSASLASGGSASRALGGSASSKRPNEGTAKDLDADKKPRGGSR